MRRRFFVEQFECDLAFLRNEAAHHLGRVLRAEAGQVYELSDGTSVRLGTIVRASRDAIEFSLGESVPAVAQRVETTLLLSVVKFDRFEWALEKATELGVSAVTPLDAARSEKGLVVAAVRRAERWRKILIESAQQARRLRPPVLNPVAKVAEAFKVSENADEKGKVLRVMLSERVDAKPIREFIAGNSGERCECAVLAIGPEGGWTDEEFALAQRSGFVEASLGVNILRTETSVAAALAILNYALG